VWLKEKHPNIRQVSIYFEELVVEEKEKKARIGCCGGGHRNFCDWESRHNGVGSPMHTNLDEQKKRPTQRKQEPSLCKNLETLFYSAINFFFGCK